MKNLIIIPDVHGRTFWHDAVKDITDDDFVIFLGDYVDPYTQEGITKEDAFCELEDVIEFKQKHVSNVVLLLGNHDLSYLDRSMAKCRHDHDRHNDIKHIFESNMNLFDIACLKEIEGHKYLFTHSGIIQLWLEKCGIDIDIEPEELVKTLNDKLHNDYDSVFDWLSYFSYVRGGWDQVGSCVWADLSEIRAYYNNNFYKHKDNVYQIFGHSQQYKFPVIEEKYACLDCRRAFTIKDGKIELYPKGINYDDTYIK